MAAGADPNLHQLESAARNLGPLLDEFTLVGARSQARRTHARDGGIDVTGAKAPTSSSARSRGARWSVYLVRTANGALYTGISTDVDRRFEQHATGRGAKALRGRGPLALVYRVAIGDRSTAQSVEHALKRLSKTEKEEVVRAQPKRRRWVRRRAKD